MSEGDLGDEENVARCETGEEGAHVTKSRVGMSVGREAASQSLAALAIAKTDFLDDDFSEDELAFL